MSLLHKVKEWFSKLFKRKTHVEYVTVDTQQAEYTGPDIRFYTENYKIDADTKKRLTRLVQYQEFRDFEKYLDWRVNASAHRMKALLNERKDNEAANEAASIDALVKITQDMQNFWQEVKLMEAEKDILIKNGNKKSPKIFGEDAVSLSEIIDEAIVL